MSHAPPPACPFCASAHPVHKPLAESTHWKLYRHADPVPIAGWMMLATRAHRSGLEAMSDEESAQLGALLRALAQATQAVTGATRIYSLSFNEAVPHFHMHIIPRFAEHASTQSWALADFYRSVAGGTEHGADAATAARVASEIASEVRTLLPAVWSASSITHG